MALVDGRVAEVATGRGHHVGSIDVERRGELLARGIAGDADRPVPLGSSLPSASDSLWMSPFGEVA